MKGASRLGRDLVRRSPDVTIGWVRRKWVTLPAADELDREARLRGGTRANHAAARLGEQERGGENGR